MAGWVRLLRDVKKHWLWSSAVKFQWWVDLLLTVNYEPTKVLVKGQLIDCDFGQSVRSLETYAKEWNVTKKTVSDFFKLLQKDNLVFIENLKITTRLTICNFELYSGDVNGAYTESKRSVYGAYTESKRRLHTNKEYKKDNKERNEELFSAETFVSEVENFNYKKIELLKIKKNDLPENLHQYFDVAISFLELFKRNLNEAGAAVAQIEKSKGTWIDDIKKIIEIDKYNFENLREIYKFLQTDNFWKKNIISTAKLREQMPKLILTINSQKNEANKRNNPNAGRDLEELARIMQKHTQNLQQRDNGCV